MRKTLSYIVAAATFILTALPLVATEKPDSIYVGNKDFRTHTVLEKGEKVVGISVIFTSIDSNNSELFLIANGIDAGGNLFRARPNFFYAYKDNAAVGLRLSFSSARLAIPQAGLSLFSEDLSTTVSNVNCRWSSYGTALFHRNYFGLDRKGTVGLFCEFQLGYEHIRLDYETGKYNTANQAKLVFSPGLILYIIPFVSVEVSLGLADLTYTESKSYVNNALEGTLGKFGGGAHFNLLNCNLGISYHF